MWQEEPYGLDKYIKGTKYDYLVSGTAARKQFVIKR
jgi:hypothetical protein